MSERLGEVVVVVAMGLQERMEQRRAIMHQEQPCGRKIVLVKADPRIAKVEQSREPP